MVGKLIFEGGQMRMKYLVGAALLSLTIISHASEPPSRLAFVLFYRASCPHCRRFEPVISAYAASHHLPILAYTLDGSALSSFPESMQPNQNELQQFFPYGNPVVPTLFLMDSRRHRIYPILKGEASMQQLSRRMRQVTARLEG